MFVFVCVCVCVVAWKFLSVQLAFMISVGMRGFHSGSVKRSWGGNYNTNYVLMIVVMACFSL